jgi:predicted permease
MTSLLQEIRYSLRVIAKSPGFAAIAILTLALGIGANTTIFSWINSALLNPVPGISNPDEVVSLTLNKPGEKPFPFTYPDIEALRKGQQSLTGITACGFAQTSLAGKGKPERVWGMVASANYFDVLGVRPILGRGFLPEEDAKPGGAPVAVISYRLWQARFGSNPEIVGQTIGINQHPYTIVGVTPAVFQGSQTGVRTDIWVPMMMEAQFEPLGDLLNDHHEFWLLAFGRLKPGIRLEQAQQEMTLRLKPEVESYPDEHKGHESVTVYPLWRNPFGLNQFLSTLLPILMCIAGMVLLLACANVANLMLVRSVGRRRELAIRLSLGASRWQLARHLLVESLILALAGGVVALLITFWTQGTPCLAQCQSGPYGVARDAGDFSAHRSYLRYFACAAGLKGSSRGGIEGRHRERIGWRQEGTLGEQLGGGADFTVAAAAGLRGIVHSEFPERAANQSRIQSP